ncbi:MAG TPA: SPFH domain-containing protein [Ktedonobacterales bacterium]|jgi:flotillin
MNFAVVIAIIVVIAAIAFLFLLSWLLGNLYRKVGPNTALVVYGLGVGEHGKVVTNSGTFIVPAFQRAQDFSLELMSFDVAPQQNLYTNQGVAVRVEAVTQLKVRNSNESILTAAEQFLSKSDDDRESMIRLVMEGHLRGIVGQLTVEQIVKEPEMVSEKMRTTSSADLAKMGLEVVSFTIKEVRDENDYISNMGRPEIERVKKEANIAAALAQRDTQIQQANAAREAAVAKAGADQARVEAEAASQAKQAEFQRDLALKRASYDAEVKKQQVVAEKASDLQAAIQQQQIVAETARAQEIEKTAQVKVQEAEAQRRQMELSATVVKAAEAERQRVETMADAERQRATVEAEGRAAALRAQAAAEGEAAKIRGVAEAEAARAKGLAQAEVIRAQGEAEAEAMRVKAAAYREYNQAAVLDKLITNLPEVVRAVAEPLAKVDKISIVSTGNGAGGGSLGASRLTGDVVNILAQVPALIEALTGARVGNLLERLPGLADGTTVDGTAVSTNGSAPNGTSANGAPNGQSPTSTNGSTPAATPEAPTAPAAGSAPATPNTVPTADAKPKAPAPANTTTPHQS